MDAKLNLISPTFPVNNDYDSFIQGEKKDAGPSFESVLSETSKKEPVQQKSQRPEKTEEPLRSARSERTEPERPERPVRPERPEKTTRVMETQSEKIDDRAGVIAESYEASAASYPVSRIAKESLDEKTVKTLKDQGLWDLPTMVMAQPSQQFMLMKAATENGDGVENESLLPAIPVSKPIAQFMASLENELSVEPDRLVQAFKKLPAGQLQLSPAKTMVQVVKNLNLSPKDQARALDLYSKMLAEMQVMKEESLNPNLMGAAVAVGGMTNQLPTEKLDDKNVVKGRTQQALARYSDSHLEKANPLLKNLQPETVNPKMNPVTENDFKLPVHQQEEGRESLKASSQGQDLVTPDKGTAVVTQTYAPDEGAKIQGLTNLQPQAQDQVQTQNVIQDTHVSPNPIVVQPQNAQNSLGDDKAFKSLKVSKDSKETLSVKGTDSLSLNNQSPVNLNANDQAMTKLDIGAGSTGASNIAANELKTGQDTKHEAIRSIVNQAQMLAQKGGGEVRMSLKPDHLGEIQLKVAMEGNRVNVQMTTERSEVKKLIEQSVHELRHGLASHNLSMEKLDVSVNNRDMQFPGKQPDFGAARDFAQQFHQQQDNRRDLMQDVSSLRANAQKSMMTMDRATQAGRAMSSRNSAGRLNVVA